MIVFCETLLSLDWKCWNEQDVEFKNRGCFSIKHFFFASKERTLILSLFHTFEWWNGLKICDEIRQWRWLIKYNKRTDHGIRECQPQLINQGIRKIVKQKKKIEKNPHNFRSSLNSTSLQSLTIDRSERPWDVRSEILLCKSWFVPKIAGKNVGKFCTVSFTNGSDMFVTGECCSIDAN